MKVPHSQGEDESPPNPAPLIEVCLDSADSAVAAESGGARRVELCANLIEGGTTPSAGMIAATRAAINIGLQVMIRPPASRVRSFLEHL